MRGVGKRAAGLCQQGTEPAEPVSALAFHHSGRHPIGKSVMLPSHTRKGSGEQVGARCGK